MDPYTSFAAVYDIFMDNIPYSEWCESVTGLLQENGIRNGLVLDLGCGTGTMTRMLSQKGYDMIGIDYSHEMLQIAMEKKLQTDQDILYLLQDMREFELYGTVAAVVSICDSVNYITEYTELVQVFCRVNNYLDPGGIFLFDLNTIYKYKQILGESTIAENREEGSFIWENFYDEDEMVNEYDLTLFIREPDGRYQKFEETHYQRAYSLDIIMRAIEASGMVFIGAYDAETKNPVTEYSERIYILARESGKALPRDYCSTYQKARSAGMENIGWII